MSKLNDWKDNELYPALFDKLDRVLPEFEFKDSYGKWISGNGLKIDGSTGKTGKVYIYSNAPHILQDWTRGKKEIAKYIEENKGYSSYIDALKHLAEIAGLRPPQDPNYDPEKHRKAEKRRNLLEEANSYFIHLLTEHDTGGDQRDAVLNYLQEDRGYSMDTIKDMKLGYCPKQDRLFRRLQDKGYTLEEIKEALPIAHDTRIGDTHRIAIPFRAGGRLKGFKFRTHGHGETDRKYLNTKGLDKSSAFFNIGAVKGDKDVVIVEGELDALHAAAKGVEQNIVATAGNSINDEQIQDAVRRGAKSFTVCLDYEKGKEEETVSTVNNVTEIIRSTGVERVYIVDLPDIGQDKTDPDTLIKEKGIDAFKDVLSKRKTYGGYHGEQIIKKLTAKAEGGLDAKDRDLAIEEIAAKRSRMTTTQDRIDFNNVCINEITAHKKTGITEERIKELEEDNRQAQDEAKRSEGLKELLRKANATDDSKKALEQLKEGLKRIDISTGAGLVTKPKTVAIYREEIANIQLGLKTGYSKLDEFIRIPPAAITLIAGRTSHGKTTFMFNLMMNMSEANPDKRFYFFTFEEPDKNVFLKLLNREINESLKEHYPSDIKSNYEFLKHYERTGRKDIPEIERAYKTLTEKIDNRRITIIPENRSIEELYREIIKENSQQPIGAIFMDYIQRMRTERRTQDKRTEVAHISDQVLQIAKDTGLPIILGAQFSRKAEDTPGKAKASHLKEAGNLEEDANLVLSVYQPAKDEENEGNDTKRKVELEIRALKNREGQTNKKAVLTFDTWTLYIYNEEPMF